MTNSLAEDVYILGETMADNLVTMGVTTADADDGLTTLAGKILDIPNKQSTTLTISVPLNLEYGDNFNITGSLTSNGDGVSGATIKLKVGNTVVDTDTTDGTGAVSFTQCPVATGTHSFQLVFDGDLNHASSSSSVVTRDVSKETSVVTVDYPVAGTNYYTDSTVLVEGTLTDNDATPLASKTVKVKDSNNTVLASLTTDSNGDFSGNVSISTAGACTLTIVYEGNEYYTTTSESRSIVMVAPSISLVSDKSILSYADGDSATLTATLSASDVSGKTVTFEVRKVSDDSLVESLSDTTDSSGIASVSYLGKHAGDLYIKAFVDSMIQSEIYVEDCMRYIPTIASASSTSSKLNNVADFGVFDGSDTYYSAILSFSSMGVGVVGGLCVVNQVQTSSVSPYPNNYCDYRLFSDINNKGLGGGCKTGGDYGMNVISGTLSTNTEYLFEMMFENGELTGKITKVSDNTVVYNQTITPPKDYTNYHFALFLFGNITETYKEIKIKQL